MLSLILTITLNLVCRLTPIGSTDPPRIITRTNPDTVSTLTVNGKPLIIFGAQCDIWRSTRQDETTKEFFDAYRDMHSTVVSVGIPWSKTEPQQDRYDFKFIDWFIDAARKRHLKLVLNLFNTNVCGKVAEGLFPGAYPQYTPSYILNQPGIYHRMKLPYPYKYVEGGPPMCPNDPNTLERERKMVVEVAKHLKLTDSRSTVVMLQIDNEFYYQQWDGNRPAYGSPEERAVRCQCDNCISKWTAGNYATGEEFMFRSFAEYVRSVTDGIAAVYPLPMYLNSPWWPPRIVPIFLQTCPHIAFVGIDGVLSPAEPAIFSLSQVDRNIPFAAENPTENAETRLNLDVLPYYTAIGRMGIGNLLWECGSPFTVLDDPLARRKYTDALLPIEHAMLPLAGVRGTDSLMGWYEIRELRPAAPVDGHGNFTTSPITRTKLFVRKGKVTEVSDTLSSDFRLDGTEIVASASPAGFILRTGYREVVIGSARGNFRFMNASGLKAEFGRFVGAHWVKSAVCKVNRDGAARTLEMGSAAVIRVRW